MGCLGNCGGRCLNSRGSAQKGEGCVELVGVCDKKQHHSFSFGLENHRLNEFCAKTAGTAWHFSKACKTLC